MKILPAVKDRVIPILARFVDEHSPAQWLTESLQRTGAGRLSLMSHWFHNIIGLGGRALPAPVTGRSATLNV